MLCGLSIDAHAYVLKDSYHSQNTIESKLRGNTTCSFLKGWIAGKDEQTFQRYSNFILKFCPRNLVTNYRFQIQRLYSPSLTTLAWKILNIPSKQCASVAAYLICSSVRGWCDQSLHWSSYKRFLYYINELQ